MSQFSAARKNLKLKDGREVRYYGLDVVEQLAGIQLAKLPYSLRVLLESLLRNQGHPAFQEQHVLQFARWTPSCGETEEFPYLPARVLFQDLCLLSLLLLHF